MLVASQQLKRPHHPGTLAARRSRSSGGVESHTIVIVSAGTATHLRAAADLPSLTRNLDLAASTSRHRRAYNSPTRIPVAASVSNANR